jgi:hypothetical protein
MAGSDRLCGPDHAALLVQGHPHRPVAGGADRAHWGIENRAHHVRDRLLGEDASRIRCHPGIFARIRSFALNILRAHGVANVSEAIHTNTLSLDRLLAYGLPRSEN